MEKTPETKKLNYVRTGPRGDIPVLLLHAVGTDLTLWGPQIAALRQTHDVIAVDLPGHGLSAKPEGKPSFAGLAASIGGLLDSLKTGPVHLVGISFGSMVAQRLTIDRQHLVASLTLIGSAGTFTDTVRKALSERAQFIRDNGMEAVAPLSLERWFTPSFTEKRPDVIDRVRKMLYHQDAPYHAALWDIIANLDTQPELEKVEVPAQIIVGEEDTSTPVSAAEALAKALKTDKVHVVPNATHFTNLEAPGEVNRLILDFLKSYN